MDMVLYKEKPIISTSACAHVYACASFFSFFLCFFLLFVCLFVCLLVVSLSIVCF